MREPWEREEFHLKDAAVFIKHEYGIDLKPETIFRWIRKGLPGDGGARLWLAYTKKMRRIFVRKAHLIEYINRTGGKV